ALAAAEIDSYEIYYYIGSASQNGVTVNVAATDQSGTMVSNFVIDELAGGSYFFSIATIDTSGNVSAFVDPVALNIP
ncbi:MAG: DUF4998 domain-containing protein, partial [Gammaproteobacteria bacterium]|nr:DUF4998 domain-containing protein [Gammaproteobacteria bacterium]